MAAPHRPRPASKADRDHHRAAWLAQGLDIDQTARRFRRHYHIGGLLAYRWANDLTLERAADAYNQPLDPDSPQRISLQAVSLWEQWPHGHAATQPSLRVLARLAAVYHTTTSRLVAAILDEDCPEHQDTQHAPVPRSSWGAVQRRAFNVAPIQDRLIRYESIWGAPTTIAPVDRSTLERRVVDAWRAFQRSDYSTLGGHLPDLIDQTALAARESDAADAFGVAELQCETLQLAAILLLKQGAANLAWIAADRAMFAAERAQNDLTIAGAARILAYALLGAGQYGKAKDLCLAAAARLEGEIDSASPQHLSAYGSLLLKAGMAAAMQDDRATTSELLGSAGQVADRLGQDGNYLWTAFGPTNVAVHRVSAAVELGDAGTALEYAGQVPRDRLPVLERRAHHLIDVARAHGQRRNDDDALAALLDAEQLAPDEVYVSPSVHTLVVELLGHSTRRAPELRGLAWRARVLA